MSRLSTRSPIHYSIRYHIRYYIRPRACPTDTNWSLSRSIRGPVINSDGLVFLSAMAFTSSEPLQEHKTRTIR